MLSEAMTTYIIFSFIIGVLYLGDIICFYKDKVTYYDIILLMVILPFSLSILLFYLMGSLFQTIVKKYKVSGLHRYLSKSPFQSLENHIEQEC